MHIPDGFVSGGINAVTYITAAGACAYSVRVANRQLGEKQVPLMGLTAAFVFAAQMLNFPVAGGTSGHFLGATLAAVLLGPWMCCLVMTVVLVVQCLGFADGGLTALGTNIFNMGIVGGVFCYYIFAVLRWIMPKTKGGFITAAGITAWVSVVLASGFCAAELALSGTSPLRAALPAMAGIHALIGIGEAVITTSVLAAVLNTRPDLVSTYVKSVHSA
ncbi:MAG: energy-coupling factor ABC transporter permease [bacterium]